MIAAIIQARSNSTRLPGKVLLKVRGRTLLEILIARLKLSKKIERIIVATTTNTNDKVIGQIAKKMNASVFYGDEQDVLGRFMQAVNKFKVDTVIRVTADSPLLDPKIVDQVLGSYLANKVDYASNVHPPTYPDGMDVEVFSKDALALANRSAKLLSEREHVTPYFYKNPKIFKIFNLRNSKNLFKIRLTVDDKKDFDLVKAILGNFMPRLDFSLSDIISFLEKNPSLLKINSAIIRNEGYEKSLKKDKFV